MERASAALAIAPSVWTHSTDMELINTVSSSSLTLFDVLRGDVDHNLHRHLSLLRSLDHDPYAAGKHDDHF